MWTSVGGEVEGLAQQAFTTNMGVLATGLFYDVALLPALGPFGRHLAAGGRHRRRRWAAGGAGGQRAVDSAWGVADSPAGSQCGTLGRGAGPCLCSLFHSGPARWLLETNGRQCLFPLGYCAPLGMSGRLMRWVLVGPNPASFASVRVLFMFLAGFRASVLEPLAGGHLTFVGVLNHKASLEEGPRLHVQTVVLVWGLH